MNRDLLGIRQLSTDEISDLIRRSNAYFPSLESPAPIPQSQILSGVTIANLFFENSTRTRTSFELAEKRLGATIATLSMQTSSLSKGESLLDTVEVITAMKIDCVVVRHSSAGVPLLLRRHLPQSIRIINAGDGAHEHPTQALLDAATLSEKLGTLAGKHIVIIGDILHSRVARSNMILLKKIGARVTVVAPESLMPPHIEEVFGVEAQHSLGKILSTADAVMSLRIQLERQSKTYFPSLADFRLRYGLIPSRLSECDAYLLHPGPVNRGVEIDDEGADTEKSLILRQVKRGVAMRMAILEWMFEK
ncbi:MAG: aspartate carbamoyltransferase catalytic subunit [bacterium]